MLKYQCSTFFVPFENTFKDVNNRKEKPDQCSDRYIDAKNFIVRGKNRGFGIRRENREGDPRNQVNVDEREEYKGEVLDADHAAGGEDDGGGEGVELAEGEVAAAAHGGVGGALFLGEEGFEVFVLFVFHFFFLFFWETDVADWTNPT